MQDQVSDGILTHDTLDTGRELCLLHVKLFGPFRSALPKFREKVMKTMFSL